MDHKSDLINFYADEGTDHRGRTRAEILSWDFHELEYTHDYIQWLFPLDVGSAFNTNAPLLTGEDIQTFKQSDKLQHNMIECLELMLRFYGFRLNFNGIVKSHDFEARIKNWLHPMNHNFLRITRTLKSLRLVGLAHHSDSFFTALSDIFPEYDNTIGNSYHYWVSAVSENTASSSHQQPQR